jgi:hypothetical protein
MRKIVPVLAIVLVLASCLSPYEGGEGEGLPEETQLEEVSELFKPSPLQPEWIRFYTNNPKYRGSRGYTLWTLRGEAGVLGTRTLRVRKPAGYNSAGYGMVLCHDLRLVEGILVPVMLTVMINNNGQYVIGKVIDGVYQNLGVGWVSSGGKLEAGSGLVNTINVTYTEDGEGNGTYSLKLNGYEMPDFYDNEEPRCQGQGKNGYVVVIAPSDLNGTNNTSVEVWFKEE